MLEPDTTISMWATLTSYLTPPVLFLLLNAMIATIAFTTFKSQPSISPPNNTNKQSPLQRLRSINLKSDNKSVLERLRSVKFENESDGHALEGKLYGSQLLQRNEVQVEDVLAEPTISEPSIPNSHHLDNVTESPSLDEVYGRHVVRTRSETSTEIPPEKLPAKIKKSASMKSPFAHFEEKDVVEARRPATTKPTRVTEGDEEVDAKADDFINRFKMQLKLQRMDSIVRYKEMIGRGG